MNTTLYIPKEEVWVKQILVAPEKETNEFLYASSFDQSIRNTVIVGVSPATFQDQTLIVVSYEKAFVANG